MDLSRISIFASTQRMPTHWLIRWLVGVLLASALSACAAADRMVPHSFGFDIRRNVPAIEVLDYRYGTSGLTGTSPERWEIRAGKTFGFENVNGAMYVGNSLYVKWRIKGTGEVFEETVDLKSLLPRAIAEHKIYFDIQGSKLYVYLLSPDYITRDEPRNHLFNRKYITLYPDSLQPH